MAANSTAPIKHKIPLSIPPALVVMVLVLAVGLAGFFYWNNRGAKPVADAPLTGDARDYVRSGFLPISDFNMEAHESYLKQQIVEITGKIGNTGNRVVDTVEIVCVFYDPNLKVVARRKVSLVKKGSNLAPAQTRQFRLAFDDLPESWNQAMPQMVIARIEFS